LSTAMPTRLTLLLELGVAGMLMGLGIASLRRAIRLGRLGTPHLHPHGDRVHVHPAAHAHLHLGGRALALRPLIVGLVHGAAGSGALVAFAMAELPAALD